MIVAATMVGMFDFCKMAKSGLEKRHIGKKRKEADERHATLFSFYCLPLRYILTPGFDCLNVSLTSQHVHIPLLAGHYKVKEYLSSALYWCQKYIVILRRRHDVSLLQHRCNRSGNNHRDRKLSPHHRRGSRLSSRSRSHDLQSSLLQFKS